jgi:hypothetical protein
MEFGFELALCAWLERHTGWLPARQLGAAVADPGGRVMDVVCVVPGPAFEERAAVTDGTVPPRAIASDVGVGRAVDPREAFDCGPGARERAVEGAVEAGFFERERRYGRTVVRRTARYPERWFDRLVAVENKPDLDAPGDLERQLRLDVALALFDEVTLATGSYVTRAHLNRIPEPVGVWRFDPESGERTVVREADPLPVGESGVEPLSEAPLRTDVALVSAAEKAAARRAVAERAYGKGWRTFAPPPACAHAAVTDDGRPRCRHFGRTVDPARDCGADCPGFEAGEAPAVDAAALRAERTPWVRDPAGHASEQAGLDRFG